MFKNRSFQVKLVKDQTPTDTKTKAEEVVANTVQANAYRAVAEKFAKTTIDHAMGAAAVLILTKAACDISVVIVRRFCR